MTRLVVVGDVHLADRPPSIRTETYADDIFAKVEFCVDEANRRQVYGLLFLGDIFHVKAPSRTSHELVQRTARILEASDSPVLIVPGNHDLRQDRLESIPSQPLGTLALSPRVRLLDGPDSDLPVFGIPYLDSFEEFRSRLAQIPLGTALVATHASIFPPGDHPPYPHMNADELPSGGVPVAYGHIHDSHGVYQGCDAWFCNNGAISRGSLHEETLQRKPRITLFDSSMIGPTGPFMAIQVPHRPIEEVFRLAKHLEQKAQEQRLDAFLESVGEVSLAVLSIEEIVEHARSTDLSPEALGELVAIIEEVAH